MQAQDILHFWFKELNDKQRFIKDIELDSAMTQRFGATLRAAIHGELFTWRTTPIGRLAEIIVLDQFSRNIHRDTPASFAQDAQALALAQELVDRGQDEWLEAPMRTFVYMPYMHSESLVIHEQAVRHFAQKGLENSLAFEQQHKVIIERFGRYPHRNAILERESTAQEIEFLDQPGASF